MTLSYLFLWVFFACTAVLWYGAYFVCASGFIHTILSGTASGALVDLVRPQRVSLFSKIILCTKSKKFNANLYWGLIIRNAALEQTNHFTTIKAAPPPLEAILVVFGRRALIFFLFESSWKKMKNDATFVRMRSGDHLGDAKMSKKGTSLRRI